MILVLKNIQLQNVWMSWQLKIDNQVPKSLISRSYNSCHLIDTGVK